MLKKAFEVKIDMKTQPKLALKSLKLSLKLYFTKSLRNCKQH